MSKPNEPIPTDGAVDLDAVKLRATQEEAASKLKAEQEQQRKQAALEAYALAWEQAMKRTFKGIFSHSTRKKFLMSNMERQEASA